MSKINRITSAEVKKLIKEHKLLIGTESTINNIKLGKVDKVIVSSNCPKKTLDDINYYAKLNKTEIVQIDVPNDELGVICKKPFYISVLSTYKGG